MTPPSSPVTWNRHLGCHHLDGPYQQWLMTLPLPPLAGQETCQFHAYSMNTGISLIPLSPY